LMPSVAKVGKARLVGVGGEELFIFFVETGDERVDQDELSLEDFEVLLDGLVLLCGCNGIGGVCVDKRADADDGVSDGLLLSYVEVVLQAIEGGVLLGASVGHVGERAGGLRSLPAYVIEADEMKVDRHLLVDLCFGIFDHLIEDDDVLLEDGLLVVHICDDTCESTLVGLNLGVEACLRFVDEMAVVLPFNAAFEAERDEQADGDGGEMKKKIAPAVDRLVRGMHIDHGNYLVEIH
jgi:hypothetical protein